MNKLKIISSNNIKNLKLVTLNSTMFVLLNKEPFYTNTVLIKGQSIFKNKNWFYCSRKKNPFNYIYNSLIKDNAIKQYSFFSYYGKLHMIGLGYKNFVMGNKLYILIGDCNYIILNIPEEIKIFCKKNQIYALSANSHLVFDFLATIKKIKKINFYKGKGIIEFKNFKFTKLKVGKKQRFA
jgi:ribosomal protein L6P/L9E